MRVGSLRSPHQHERRPPKERERTNANMALWVDKYRPNSLEALSVHPNLTDQLARLAASPDFPHLLFYGPSGAGKKTRILAFLRAVFGPSAERLRVGALF
jgi:replication factor C subunit 3/5